MVSYSISMFLRLVCLYLCFVVPGWWVIIPVAGVIILPAIAVMFANVVRSPGAQNATSHTLNLTSLPSGK